MKHLIKNITYSLAAISLLASCSSDNEPRIALSNGDYIVFGQPWINLDATTGNFAENAETRATLLTAVNEFVVWGYCVPKNISGSDDASRVSADWNDKSTDFTGTNDGGADLAYLAKAIVNTTDPNNYNNGTLCKWNDTKDAQSSFIAIAPGNATYSMTKSSMAGKKGPRLNITLNRNATSSIDTKLDRTEQPDILVAAKFDHKKKDGQVTLSFFHIMTALRFRFHNHSKKDLIIKEMTFKGNFHRRAIIDFTTDDPVVTVPDDDNAVNSYAGTFTIIDSPQTITHGSEDYAGGDNPAILMLLPNPDGTIDQDGKYVLGSEKSIDITYRFADDPEDMERTFTTPDNLTLHYLPQPNTLHTAHFNFIGDSFVLTFQADDEKNWENGSDNNFTIK